MFVEVFGNPWRGSGQMPTAAPSSNNTPPSVALAISLHGPAGPYVLDDGVLPASHEHPTAKVALDGTLVLYFSSVCTNSTGCSPRTPAGASYIGAAYSTSLGGPWLQLPADLLAPDCPRKPEGDHSPSVFIAGEEGAYYMLYSDDRLAVAGHWRGPFHCLETVPALAAAHNPFLWNDGRGWHILADNGFLAASVDAETWQVSAVPAYNLSVPCLTVSKGVLTIPHR